LVLTDKKFEWVRTELRSRVMAGRPSERERSEAEGLGEKKGGFGYSRKGSGKEVRGTAQRNSATKSRGKKDQFVLG